MSEKPMPRPDKNYDWSNPHGFARQRPEDYAPHDPANDHAGEHGHKHHVSSIPLLVGVLLALLALTGLTVAVAQGEVWLVENFGIHISQLTNVIIAMSIASVKALLVCMYFMHLRHDNPLNTYILLFTIITFGLFLAFPSIDIATRGVVDPAHEGQVVEGGSRDDGPIIPTLRREAMAKAGFDLAKAYAKNNPPPEGSIQDATTETAEEAAEPDADADTDAQDTEAEASRDVETSGPAGDGPDAPSSMTAAETNTEFETDPDLDLPAYFPPNDARLSEKVDWLESGNPWGIDFWTAGKRNYWINFYEKQIYYGKKITPHPEDDTAGFEIVARSHPDMLKDPPPDAPSPDRRVTRTGRLLTTQTAEPASDARAESGD